MDTLTQGPGSIALPILAGLAAGATPGGARGISGLSNILALQEEARQRRRVLDRESRLGELIGRAATPQPQPPRLEPGFAAAPIQEVVPPELTANVRPELISRPAPRLSEVTAVAQPPVVPLEQPGGFTELTRSLAASGFGPEAANLAARRILAQEEAGQQIISGAPGQRLFRRGTGGQLMQVGEVPERPKFQPIGEGQGLFRVDPATGQATEVVSPRPKRGAPHFEAFTDAQGNRVVAIFTSEGKQSQVNLGPARDPQSQAAVLSKYRIDLAQRAQNKVTGNRDVDGLSTQEAREQLELLRSPEFISGVIPGQRAITRGEEEGFQQLEAEEEAFARTGQVPGAGTPQAARPAPAGRVETLSRRDARYQAARQRGLTDQQIQQQFGLRLVD